MPFFVFSWLVWLGMTTRSFDERERRVTSQGVTSQGVTARSGAGQTGCCAWKGSMGCFKSSFPNRTKLFSKTLLWSTGVLQWLVEYAAYIYVRVCIYTFIHIYVCVCLSSLASCVNKMFYFFKRNYWFYQDPVLFQIKPLPFFMLCKGFNLLPA